MPHGAPDFAQYRPESVTFPVLDLAELAVRLGSIVSFDRRGDVMWMDDFENGLAKWDTNGTETGWAVAISTAKARNGGSSVALTCGVTYSGSAWIYRNMPMPVLSKWGLEVSFATDADFRQLQVTLDYFTGANLYGFRCRYDYPTTTVAYRDANQNWVTLASNVDVWMAKPFQFHTLKVVADLVGKKYARVLFNERALALDALSQADANTQPPSLYVTITAYGNAGVNNVVYLDDVIVTQNEP